MPLQKKAKKKRTRRRAACGHAGTGSRLTDAPHSSALPTNAPHWSGTASDLAPPSPLPPPPPTRPLPPSQIVAPRAQTAASGVAESAAQRSGLHGEAEASRVEGGTETGVASPDVVSQGVDSSSKRPSSRSLAVRASSASRRPGTGTAPPGSARVVSASARSATAGKSMRPGSTANAGTADAATGVAGEQLTNVARDQLQPLPQPEEAMATTEQLLREGTLQSLLKALGLLRRLVAFHSSLIQPCMYAGCSRSGAPAAISAKRPEPPRVGRRAKRHGRRESPRPSPLTAPPSPLAALPLRSDDMALLTNRCLVHNSNTVRTVAALVVGDMCSVFGDDMLRHLHGTQPGSDPLILSLLNVATGTHRGAAAAASSTLKCVSRGPPGEKGEAGRASDARAALGELSARRLGARRAVSRARPSAAARGRRASRAARRGKRLGMRFRGPLVASRRLGLSMLAAPLTPPLPPPRSTYALTLNQASVVRQLERYIDHADAAIRSKASLLLMSATYRLHA